MKKRIALLLVTASLAVAAVAHGAPAASWNSMSAASWTD